jgi:hypothetical protein
MNIRLVKFEKITIARFSPKYDVIRAYTDFYDKEIPEIGYKQNDIAFEYYSDGFYGKYELRSLAEKVG